MQIRQKGVSRFARSIVLAAGCIALVFGCATPPDEHVITHEIGHTLGFRHSDYYTRSISCGSCGNEGAAGFGAIHIQGTPTTDTLGGSIMNSCFRTVETGEFNSSDITALRTPYAHPEAFRRVLSGWTQPETGWSGYTLHVVDVSGDGRADLVWNYLGTNNLTYSAISEL